MEHRKSDQWLQSTLKIPVTHEQWEDHRSLKRAIRHGRTEEAKRLLSRNVPVNVYFKATNGYIGVTPLHLAVYQGNLDLIKILLDQGASVNAQDTFYETPLMLSVRLRKYSVTDLLLTADSIENLWDCGDRLNHLHIACFRNNIFAAKKLIDLGARVNTEVRETSMGWKGYTPLHFAVEGHSVEIVKLLVDNGADVMSKNARSMTPLHLAHEMRNEEIIDILLAAKMFISLNVLENPTDGYSLSHFHIACTRNNVEFVEHFLKQGVDIESEISPYCIEWANYRPLTFAIYYECPDVVELLLRKGAQSWNFNLQDFSYLGLAYDIGNQKVISLLSNSKIGKIKAHPQNEFLNEIQIAWMTKNLRRVEKSCSCRGKKSVSNSNSSPLHELFEKNGRSDIRVISVTSDLFNHKLNPSDQFGLTHFHIACTIDNTRLLKKFVQNGVNVNDAVSVKSLKWSGYTALHFAVEYQHLSAVGFLLEYGAKISQKNGNDLTPFDLALLLDIEINKFEIIKKLLVERENNSNNDFDDRGFSLLHVLAITRETYSKAYFLSCLDELPEGINQSVNFPKSKYHRCTALHLAMRTKNYEIASLLISHGADIRLKDNRGYSPLQYEIDSIEKLGILENDPKLLCAPGNPFAACGKSYFHIACLLGNRKIMEYHVKSGVDINVRTKFGLDGRCSAETPLHVVSRNPGNNGVNTVKFLLNHGADVTARDAFLNTPLHNMSFRMMKETLESFVALGADVNAQNYRGDTPLLSVSWNSMPSSKMIAFMLDNGADVNIKNNIGDTPLTRVCDKCAGVSLNENVLILIKHVKKLMVLGLYVSHTNKKMFAEFVENYTIDNFDEVQFGDECLKEISMMKECKIDQFTSVYNVILKSPNDMAHLSQNSYSRELIDSDDFASNFPIYGYLIKLQYKRGLVRKPLLDECKLAFNFLVKLPLESVEKILDSLSNEDLENIIKSKKMSSAA